MLTILDSQKRPLTTPLREHELSRAMAWLAGAYPEDQPFSVQEDPSARPS
jgi:hypothetical protein